ncbi:hypothetical protein [Polaribacter aestuariivivens]|uniref:hypothetical protein n=1 Tax=Polaribacter aestuariivivens TaxID=2304626 RepID=UPI003F4932F0
MMKNIKHTFILAIVCCFLSTNAQEKKIKFNKGTLKICSSKSFIIEGYDGDEVIIESLHQKRENNFKAFVSGKINDKSKKDSLKSNHLNGRVYSFKGASGNYLKRKNRENWKVTSTAVSGVYSENDTTVRPKTVFFKMHDTKRKDGLKKLGKKNENSELAIYFIIEQNGDELLFKDDTESRFIMTSNREQYKIKIPNSIRLNWSTKCSTEKKDRNYFFFNSEKSSLSNFEGEAAISTSIHNINLKDVSGPVTINTIGGNVTIEFDKKTPKKLYSVYSNNGFIDITLPTEASLNVDAIASDIFSDINFKIMDEKETEGLQKMKLKLNSGKTLMKLNAGLGNIYLRKQ